MIGDCLDSSPTLAAIIYHLSSREIPDCLQSGSRVSASGIPLPLWEQPKPSINRAWLSLHLQ